MKRLFLIVIVIIFSVFTMQSQNIKQVASKTKYENIFYRTSTTKYAPFMVERIVYSSNFQGMESKSSYQVSVYGTVNGSKKQLNHNVQSTNELKYYQNLFNKKYKRINLFEGRRKVGGKTYFDTSIAVEL
ncbi:hypothetical protein N1F78_01405 [Seonamhaeicola sp. MEBiC1930]|uniref:hypothetical protein n=1 Tax=Seonamhaeicola sp. MEBiC01930 TaxID=2976768 RepID=UPI003243EE73